MRVLLNETVLDAAKRRIRWLFEEFPVVVVNVSGGKDSTVVYHLTLEIARELGRLPLKCFWIDQEAEWASTVRIVREWMQNPDVEPMWLQVPFRIFNATSLRDHWLEAWEPGKEDVWIHPRDPLAITENVYGTDRFAKLYPAAMAYHFPGQKVAQIGGVRAEESAARTFGLTSYEVYGGETWGNVTGSKKGEQHYTFYPIYDWSFRDVWKAIYDHEWPYNRVYDMQYRYGVGLRQMRVSNLHHETAVQALFYVQEFEPDTYAKLTKRLSGVDTAGKLGIEDYFPESVPFMFKDWRDYRDYLLDALVDDPKWRDSMRKRFESQDKRLDPAIHDRMLKQHVKAILVNDWEGITLNNFETATARKYRQTDRRVGDRSVAVKP